MEGARRCIVLAIKDAGITPADIDYVNPHATATPVGDRNECQALRQIFGDQASQLVVSGTKSMTGHLLGAAGGIESVITVLSITHGILPPTINYETPDPECDLDYVPNTARRAEVRYALTNSFGFGGTNASLLFKKFEE
jgi:3-oxoacyl-[acyl-carrier-protein] synthase II